MEETILQRFLDIHSIRDMNRYKWYGSSVFTSFTLILYMYSFMSSRSFQFAISLSHFLPFSTFSLSILSEFVCKHQPQWQHTIMLFMQYTNNCNTVEATLCVCVCLYIFPDYLLCNIPTFHYIHTSISNVTAADLTEHHDKTRRKYKKIIIIIASNDDEVDGDVDAIGK